MNVVELAKAVYLEEAVEGMYYASADGLKRFANIVRILALEEAAKRCEQIDPAASSNAPNLCAKRIREMKE